MANRWGNNGNSDRLYFLGLKNHCEWWLQPWNLKMFAPWNKSYDKPRQRIPVVMDGCELDYKESWAPKNWCFWTVLLEKILESSLGCKEIQPVHPKGDQSWVFIGKTDVEAETPILRPPDAKSWLIWKDPDPGKDWVQEEKGTTEDEMVGGHPWLNGHGFGWTPAVGDGQGGLECCGWWVRKLN